MLILPSGNERRRINQNWTEPPSQETDHCAMRIKAKSAHRKMH